MGNILPMAGFILVGIAIFLVIGFLIMLLWNWLLPNISSLKRITYLQALGILILAKLLFGNFCHHGHGWGHHWNRSSYCSGNWNGGNCHKEPGAKTEEMPKEEMSK